MCGKGAAQRQGQSTGRNKKPSVDWCRGDMGKPRRVTRWLRSDERSRRLRFLKPMVMIGGHWKDVIIRGMAGLPEPQEQPHVGPGARAPRQGRGSAGHTSVLPCVSSSSGVPLGVVTFCWTPVSLFFDYAMSPSSRLRLAMLVPKVSLILSSRYQVMYASSRSMNPLMVTPAKSRPWKNSCLGRPKNPSAAALSGEQPFALIDRVSLCSPQMRIHPGHR